jgi:serine/threonine protein kinase
VYKAWWSGGQVVVAVKANGVACADTAAIDNELRLLALLQRFPHRNVIRMFGVCRDAPAGQGVLVVMEYCGGGSLDGYLRRVRGRGEVRLMCV